MDILIFVSDQFKIGPVEILVQAPTTSRYV